MSGALPQLKPEILPPAQLATEIIEDLERPRRYAARFVARVPVSVYRGPSRKAPPAALQDGRCGGRNEGREFPHASREREAE
jgi:hypothetical protein